MHMTDFVVVATTTDDREAAERIARAVIERRLGGCARILAADSVYRWNGEIVSTAEFVVEVKTTATRRSDVEAAIQELHGYDLPEIVVHPILGGSAAYLDWLAGEVG
jgi:periplasmic divalent cation tolerance protein